MKRTGSVSVQNRESLGVGLAEVVQPPGERSMCGELDRQTLYAVDGLFRPLHLECTLYINDDVL